jgi:soluble lytic murein transglycosylase-like protein
MYLTEMNRLKKTISPAPLLLTAIFLFGINVFGQETGETTESEPPVEVGKFMERILARTQIAASAADVVVQADKLRREAERELKAGRRGEAVKLLRQAGELIAAATPEEDERREDPLLRQYLSEITAKLVELSQPPTPRKSEFPLPANFPIANGVYPSIVTAYVNFYSRGKGRRTLEVGYARLNYYRPMMARIFREEGLPEWLLAAAFVESTYNPTAGSSKQAVGIWQFIPGTGDRYGLRRTAYVDERTHPEKSTRAAARYLRDLYALFGDWKLALAAYNWGETRVARLIRRTGVRDFWTLAARGYFPAETANYVPAILAAAQLFNLPGALPPQQVNAAYQLPPPPAGMKWQLVKQK